MWVDDAVDYDVSIDARAGEPMYLRDGQEAVRAQSSKDSMLSFVDDEEPGTGMGK